MDRIPQGCCVVCKREFIQGDKVKSIAPDHGLYFACRDHFEEPIPEPPGEPKDSLCMECSGKDGLHYRGCEAD